MKKALCSAFICFTLAACGVGETNSTYSRYDIGQQAQVQYGTIISMRPVNIKGTSTVGTIGGAVAGGAAGSMIGGNTAVNIIGATGGAIVGGVIGNATEQAITKDTAYEFIIRKQNGQTVAVVQSNENHFRVGDNVILTVTDGTTRIQLYQ